MAVAPTTVAYWDGLNRWGQDLNPANRQRIQETVALVPEDVQSVLDLGAGDGTVSNSLAARGLWTAGIDISIVALQHCAGARTVAATDAIPFADASFDLVICAEVLEHLPVDIYQPTLREIERVARRYIIITTPNEEYLPAGFVRCAFCSARYHMNLHVRTFDGTAHRELFSSFEQVRTVPIERWRHSPKLTALEHALFMAYREKEGVVCPCCHHAGYATARFGPLGRPALRFVRRIGLRTGHWKPRWIASLYSSRS